jgi:transcriptional regulator with XRE-family HTH domain
MLLDMSFPQRLTTLRKQQGLTQQTLAERVGVQVLQIRRYESGASQPTLEVIRKLAVALSVTADYLIFDKSERDPDEELRLQFEAVSKFSKEEKKIIKALLESMILRHEAKKWSSA